MQSPLQCGYHITCGWRQSLVPTVNPARAARVTQRRRVAAHRQTRMIRHCYKVLRSQRCIALRYTTFGQIPPSALFPCFVTPNRIYIPQSRVSHVFSSALYSVLLFLIGWRTLRFDIVLISQDLETLKRMVALAVVGGLGLT